MALLFWLSVLFVAYTLAGYPLAIALLSRARPPIPKHPPSFPTITLLISAYNEEPVIVQKLDNSLALDYPKDRLHILVAADGSDDATSDIVSSYRTQGVDLNHVPERKGKMAAINRAMSRATGEIVVFSDANNIYDRDAILKLVVPFHDPAVGASTGAKSIIRDGRDLSAAGGLYWRYESAIKRYESRFGSCAASTGEILAIRRSLFEPPPDGVINDDHYMILDIIRRGYRVVYTADARSFEHFSASPRDEVRRQTRTDAGLVQTMMMAPELLSMRRPLFLWQIVSHKFFRLFIPFALMVAFGSNFVMALRMSTEGERVLQMIDVPFAWGFLFLQCAFYGLAVLGNTITFGGRLGKLLYLPTYFVNSNLAVLKGFYAYFSGKQKPAWQRVRRVDAQ